MTCPNLHISQHPIVAVKLSQLREAKQNSKAVRELMRELATLVGYEATSNIGISKDKTVKYLTILFSLHLISISITIIYYDELIIIYSLPVHMNRSKLLN